MLQPPRQIRNVLVAIAALFSCAASFGAPVVLNSAYPSDAQLTLVSDTPRETVFELQFGLMDVSTVQLNGTDWVTLHVDGMQSTAQSGWPELPQLSAWVLASVDSRVEILESEFVARTWGNIIPAADPLSRNAPAQFQRIPATEFYGGTALYPSSPVSISLQGQLRGTNVGLVTFTPVQFDPVSRQCTIYTRLRVRIDRSRGALDQLAPRSPATSFLLERLLAGNGSMQPAQATGSPRILVVTEPQFASVLQPFMEWKLRSGLPSRLIIYSQVANSASQLRNYLVQLMDSAQVPPDYLLLVGDVDVIPAFYGVGQSLTDHLYSTLQGNDYLPDISLGRLPCHTALECSDWVNRILAYERDGSIANSVDATVFSSSSALDPQHGTFVQNLFNSAGFSTDRFQEPQNSSLSQLMNSLNVGREWVFYIGHGFPQAWSSVSPYFDNAHTHDVQTAASSIVVSVACGTADFDYPGSSIAEHWVEQSAASGVLAYFGATEPTAFFYSDTLGLGVLRAVFNQHFERLGDAADYGKLATAQAFPQGYGGLTEETIQQFELLGDPSLRIFSAAPQTLNVTYSNAIPVNVATLPVAVQSNGQPVANADICISSDAGDFYVLEQTDASGEAALPIGLSDPVVLHVVVTAHNAVPYHGTLHVIPLNGPFLQLAGITVSDSLGDNDGRADRGEACALRVALANLGNQSSTAGTLSISTSDPRLQIAPAAVSFSAILAGDTVWGNTAVPAQVGMTADDLGAALLLVHALLEDNSELSVFQSLILHAPQLEFMDHTMLEDSGDGDGQPEPGETMRLILRLQNIGSDRLAAPAVSLSASSDWISLRDTLMTFSTVPEGDTVVAAFGLQTSLNTPRGEPLSFTYSISGANLPVESGSGVERIGQVPVFLYVLDEQPEQVDAIEASLASLGIEYERAVQLPQNLNRYRSIWIFCGVFPNQTPLSESAGQQLATYLQDGGNCYLEGGDTWAFDPPTAMHALFHIDGVQDGTGNSGPFHGEYGTEYEGYAFEYSGEDMFIDQLAPGPGAMVMLRNNRPGANYPVCISYAGPSYRTIGCSVELGSVVDAAYPSTRAHLVSDICRWFGVVSRVDIYPPVILHEPITEYNSQFAAIPILADIQDATGIQTADLIYRVNDGAESTVPMSLNNGLYRALLPGARFGSEIRYRLRATDSSPLHSTAETAEYALEVVARPDLPVAYDFAAISRHGLDDRVSHDEDGAWTITGTGDERMLQMQCLSNGHVQFTTGPFDCSSLLTAHLQGSHYLHLESGAVARILASADGGNTFPIVLWERSSNTSKSSDGGALVLHDLDALTGQSSAALRFDFQGPGFWRIGDFAVSGQTSLVTAPVKGVTISARTNGVRLFWPRNKDARQYRILATSDNSGNFAPVATTRDTTYSDQSAKDFNFRLYRVEAILRDIAAPSLSLDSTEVNSVSARETERQWNLRRHGLP